MKGSIFAFAAVLLSGGCAVSETTSYRDQRATHYRSALVAVLTTDIRVRRLGEAAIVKAMADKKLRGVPSITYVPPTRTLNGPALLAAARAAGLDAILVFRVRRWGSSNRYVPAQYIPGTTTTSLERWGNTTYAVTRTSPGRIEGGYNVSAPWAKYSATLYDARTRKRVWVSQTDSGGNSYTRQRDLFHSAARSVAAALIKDGVM